MRHENDEGQSMIRLFHKADIVPQHRMICDTIDGSYAGIYPPRAVDFFMDHHSERKITERSTTGEVLLLERDGFILATGSLVGTEIVGVFVHPDYQGQDYGKAIMTELERRARAKGLSEVTLSVSLPSRKFYEHLGYEVLAERALVM